MKIINKEYTEYKRLLDKRYDLEIDAVTGIELEDRGKDCEYPGFRMVCKSTHHDYSGTMDRKIKKSDKELIKAGRKIGKSESQVKQDIDAEHRKATEKLVEIAKRIKLAELEAK